LAEKYFSKGNYKEALKYYLELKDLIRDNNLGLDETLKNKQDLVKCYLKLRNFNKVIKICIKLMKVK
jgi:tetratricopeptide (TPR) repeat protein